MSCKYRKVFNQLGLLAAVFLFSVQEVCAEKYFTWVDENGRVQHTVIKEEENPLIIKKDATESQKNGVVEEAVSTEQGAPQVVSPSHREQGGEVTPPEAISKQELEAEVAEPAAVPAKAPQPTKTEGSERKSEFDITVVDEVDYVDGDELEQNNFVRPGEEQRYYTWRDAEGRMINSPYDGKTAADASNASIMKAAVKKDVIKLSTFDQIPSVKVASSLADANALKILGIKASTEEEKQVQISSFLGEGCCAELDFEFISELPLDDEFLVEVNRTSKKHIFQSGKSAFELVLLPHADKDYLVRFKTFIKDDAFSPTFVYLDEQFLPVRIVTNISTTYTAENWLRYAYLEGVVDAKVATAGERYLLVITTRKGVESKTVFVDEKAKDIVVSHGELGSIELFTMH